MTLKFRPYCSGNFIISYIHKPKSTDGLAGSNGPHEGWYFVSIPPPIPSVHCHQKFPKNTLFSSSVLEIDQFVGWIKGGNLFINWDLITVTLFNFPFSWLISYHESYIICSNFRIFREYMCTIQYNLYNIHNTIHLWVLPLTASRCNPLQTPFAPQALCVYALLLWFYIMVEN